MNTNMNPEIPKYKLIFLGDQSVGKSCILNRFLNDTFIEDYQATIGLDFQSKNVQIDNQDIHLLLYDTAGQEKFRSLIPMYTRDANIILLVYDISNKDSFVNLSQWLKDLTNVNMDEVILCIVGNKIDLNDKRVIKKNEYKVVLNPPKIINEGEVLQALKHINEENEKAAEEFYKVSDNDYNII